MRVREKEFKTQPTARPARAPGFQGVEGPGNGCSLGVSSGDVCHPQRGAPFCI